MEREAARIVAFALGLACAACSIAPAPAPAIANYDFGPAPDGHRAQGPRRALLVHDVSAPAWLDSPLIHYRLAYRDSARPQVYAESRWVMSPASLFTNRLRGQLSASGSGGIVQPGDGARAGYALRVELDESGKSRAVVRLRASVLGDRSLVAQRSFSVERPARTPDAEGGVRALIGASDEAIDQLIGWAVGQLRD